MAGQRFERIPLVLAFEDRSAFKETYGGSTDTVVLEGQFLKPEQPIGDVVLVFMHPTGTMNLLPLPNALARAGVPVMTCGSRYPHNDTALIMEKVLIDLGAYVRHARERLGFAKVVLAGWSGGGSLSLFYQAQAERPTITETPAGDPVDLVGAKLVPADAVMQLAAHVSRATTLTEWLDASILDEHDPGQRDTELDLYHPQGPRPPYDAAFLERYRSAQLARARRITAWVKDELAALRASGRAHEERCFVVHGTMADPRWLDPAVDPNDRVPGRCYMGDPRIVNMMPAGLGRYASLRAWLSQWSHDDSRADGPRSAAAIDVPAFVIENSADDACTPSHTRRILEGLHAGPGEARVRFERIEGATHYYLGQREALGRATSACLQWLADEGFVRAQRGEA
jgi:pimeloyl-ACP methyl ester carboxylesterase